MATAGQGTAAEPTATAWWFRGSRAGIVAPAPNVPDGGLWVATEVRDAVAVSAVRAIGDIAALHLAVADSTGAPAVRACPVAKGWEPTTAGTWEDRPDAHCDDGDAAGELSADGTTLSFAIAALGVTEVILVPAEGAAPFSITFEKPGADAIDLVPVATTTTTSRTTETIDDTAQPPMSTYAAPPLGHTAVTFDPVVDAPTTTRTTSAPALVPSPDAPAPEHRGQRTPAALVVAAAFLGIWGWRARAASDAAGDHVLAAPIRTETSGAIDAARELLVTDNER